VLFGIWQRLVEGQVSRSASVRGWLFYTRTTAATGSIYVRYRRRQDKFIEQVKVRFSHHWGKGSSMWVLYGSRGSLRQVLDSFRQDWFPYGYLRRPLQQPSAAVGRSPTQGASPVPGCGVIGDPTAAWTTDGRHLETRPPTQPPGRGLFNSPGPPGIKPLGGLYMRPIAVSEPIKKPARPPSLATRATAGQSEP